MSITNNYNADIPAKPLPNGVTETAVMQSLSENSLFNKFWDQYKAQYGQGVHPTLQEFINYYSDANGNLKGSAKTNPDMQILQSYLSSNQAAANFQVLDYQHTDGLGNKILVGGDNNGSKSYYVGFAGTAADEWLDNAEGLTNLSTLQQRDAAQYFDEMVERYGITGADNVVVTGHSKGGNKAQYVTMESRHADLIDSCVALDGQGFSNEAVEKWEKYPELYEARRQKIILVAGQNDFVHVLGNRIAADENVYYVDYDENTFGMAASDTVNEMGGTLFSYHQHQFLFQYELVNDVDADGNPIQYFRFNANMQPPATQGEFSQQIQEVSRYVMSLPPGERESAAAVIMQLMTWMNKGGTLDGFQPDLLDFISTLDTLYDMIELKIGIDLIDNPLNPASLTLKTVRKLINTLKDMQNKAQERKLAAAKANAQSIAAGNPYIHIDIDAFNEMSIRMAKLANTDFAALRRKLIDIRNQIQDIMSSLVSLWKRAEDAARSAKDAIDKAQDSIKSLMSGDIVEGISSAIDAAKSTVRTFTKILNLLTEVITQAKKIYDSLNTALNKLVDFIAMINMEDRVLKMAQYLADTASWFTTAEQYSCQTIQGRLVL